MEIKEDISKNEKKRPRSIKVYFILYSLLFLIGPNFDSWKFIVFFSFKWRKLKRKRMKETGGTIIVRVFEEKKSYEKLFEFFQHLSFNIDCTTRYLYIV